MYVSKLRVPIAALFALILCALFSGTVYARDVKVFFNGSEIRYDVPAQIIADYTMVPLSQTFEALVGAGTDYNPATRTSTFRANGHVNTHTIGTNIVFVDGIPNAMPTSSVIIGDRALVPIRMITDTSGLDIRWDDINYHVIITTPQTVTITPVPTQQPQAAVTISDATVNKSTVTSGESVTLTIKTSRTVNNVWVSDGTETSDAIYAWEDTSGIKTWVMSYRPTKTVNLTIYANYAKQESGAATRSLPITLHTPTAAPTATPAPNSSSNGVIQSAYINRTNIYSGEAITLTVKTTAATNNVWVEYNNTTQALSNPTLDLIGRTWTVTLYPTTTQHIRIWANTSQTTAGASSVTQYVEVYGTSSLSNGMIQSAIPNKTTVTQGEAVTLTIKTTSTANNVWVECNNGTLYGSNPSTDSYGIRTWTVTIYPGYTQQIRVWANSSMTTANASSVTLNINTGNNTSSANAVINSISADPTTITTGQSTIITVTTNDSTQYVWCNTGTENLTFTHQSYDAYGNKIWKATATQVATSRTITVYAGRTANVSEHSNNVYITVQENKYPVIVSIDKSLSYVSSDQSKQTDIKFTVITNSVVSYITVEYNGTSRTTSSYGIIGSNKTWDVTVPVRWSGANASYEAVIIQAHAPSIGSIATQTVNLTVQ